MAPQSSQLDSEALAWIALASAQRVSPKLWLQALKKYQLSTVDLGSNTSSLPNEVKQLTSCRCHRLTIQNYLSNWIVRPSRYLPRETKRYFKNHRLL